MLSLETFLDFNLTPLSPFSWVSESFRQDIGQFHLPWMKPCNLKSLFLIIKNILWKLWPISVKLWKPVWIRTCWRWVPSNKCHSRWWITQLDIKLKWRTDNISLKMMSMPSSQGDVLWCHFLTKSRNFNTGHGGGTLCNSNTDNCSRGKNWTKQKTNVRKNNLFLRYCLQKWIPWDNGERSLDNLSDGPV